MPWPSGSRDTTEWPEVSVSVHADLREHLQAFACLDGVGWNDFRAQAENSRLDVAESRLRTYRKMYERLGVVRKKGEQISVTPFGKAVAGLSALVSKERDEILRDLAIRACRILGRYILKNPTERGPDFDGLPSDCDIRPFVAIWKCILRLDGKLHFQELNRVLLHVMRMRDLDAAISKIQAARQSVPNGYSEQSRSRLDDLLGAEANPDQPAARMAAWFSLAGWGGLIIERSADADGFRTITPIGSQVLPAILSEPLPEFYGSTEQDWYDYYCAPEQSVMYRAGNAQAGGELISLAGCFAAHLASPQVALKIDGELQQRFIASLLSKRFLILCGLAGSGKTRLAQAFARWITRDPGCANPTHNLKGKQRNSQYEIVPVGADWTGNENILGYPNGLDVSSYIAKPALQLIQRALLPENEAHPYFLILDEMNLSHVERYFADLLSAMESGERIPLYEGAERIADGIAVPSALRLPENLFVIGTVNVDETTYMFSPKVLDRANVIEFRLDRSDMCAFLSDPKAPNLDEIDAKGAAFGPAFVRAASDRAANAPVEVATQYAEEMQLLFALLSPHGAEFGYRVAHESARLLHFYKALGGYRPGDTTWVSKAIDAAIVQKILPKLHGSRSKLGTVLKKLWFVCVNDSANRGVDALKAADDAARSKEKAAEPAWIVPQGAPYPLSACKIARMWRLLIENGFAAFAEA